MAFFFVTLRCSKTTNFACTGDNVPYFTTVLLFSFMIALEDSWLYIKRKGDVIVVRCTCVLHSKASGYT